MQPEPGPAPSPLQHPPSSLDQTPLLTIAIPTYNRAGFLAQLLATLLPQLANYPEVELLICDNGSTDDTEALVARLRTPATHYHRHPENLGSDANFIAAFQLARGHYFWLCGDDDIIVPGAIAELLSHLHRTEYDLIYATSYGFREGWLAERQQDPLGRSFHVLTDPLDVARVVNIMFTFISGMVVNKRRLASLANASAPLQAPALTIEPPSAFHGTHLTQLSWALPLLRRHRQSLVLWNRPVAARQGHNGGYALAQVFGERLLEVTQRLLPDRQDCARAITNSALRRWFPSIIYAIRSSANQTFELETAQTTLRRVFGSNPRFWVFTYPVLCLPLPLARIALTLGTAVSKLIYTLSVPKFWRKEG